MTKFYLSFFKNQKEKNKTKQTQRERNKKQKGKLDIYRLLVTRSTGL